MADTSMEVAIAASGGDASAQQINKVNDAMRQSGDTGEKAGAALRGLGKIEHIGVHMFSRELLTMVPGLEHVHGLARLLSTGITTLGNSFKALLGPIGWVIAAIGAVAAISIALVQHHKKVIEETQKLQQEHVKLVQGFQDAEKAGLKLTAAQRFYYDQLKQVETEERAVVLEHMKATIAKDREAVSTLSVWQATKMLLGSLPGMHALQEQVIKQLDQLNLQLAKDTAGYVEMKKSGLSVTEGMKAQSKETVDLTGKVQDQSKAFDENRKIVQKMYADQAASAKAGSKGENKWDAERQQIRLWQVEQTNAVKVAGNDFKAYEAIRKAAAARMSAVDRQQAEEFKQKWLAAMGPILSSFESLGVGLINSIGKGTKTAGQAIQDFGKQVLQALEAMLVKAIVLGIAFQALGLGTFSGGAMKALGFQFGGKVPGPEGEPKLAVVHGGETVANPTGTGGNGGGGTQVTQNINVGGAFASMRELHRAQRRGIKSTGELPLA